MTPPVLWTPPDALLQRCTLGAFRRERGFATYDELWRWSVTDLDGFWGSIWDENGLGERGEVLASREMPGAQWFPGTQVNYAEHAFRGEKAGPAIIAGGEDREDAEWSWAELRELTARIAAGLRALGVGKGDRVVAYLPNIPETAAAFLACASLGAIWSSCSPDFGPRSVIDRFAQIEPKVLLAVRSYRYNGREFDRSEALREITAAMRAETIVLGEPSWDSLTREAAPLEFTRVPFDHPLWVL
jgi:acetoacetyl-CoA synthetase